MNARPYHYEKLADGLRCRCLHLWKEADGSYWCCKDLPVSVGGASGPVTIEQLDQLQFGKPLHERPEPAPIGAPARSLEDRLAEALRRNQYGLIRPLWADLDERKRESWRHHARGFLTILEDCGLAVAIRNEP